MRYKATLLLASIILIPYLVFSDGTGYLPENIVSAWSFNLSSNPLSNLVFHLFNHVGLQHLLGNLITVLVFALLLESVLKWHDVVIVFFSSGLIAGALFSFLNPFTFLAGASAAASGLMASALAVRPKAALALLLLAPLVIQFIAVPFSHYVTNAQKNFLTSQKQVLDEEYEVLVKENRVQEAVVVEKKINVVATRKQVVTRGAQRQEETPTDFWVHAYGAVIGVLYLALFRRKYLEQGRKRFEALGLELFGRKQ